MSCPRSHGSKSGGRLQTAVLPPQSMLLATMHGLLYIVGRTSILRSFAAKNREKEETGVMGVLLL